MPYITLTDADGQAARATERSTFVVRVAFFDEEAAAVAPTAASWSLTDTDGVVVNSRDDVAISPLATTATIVLSGADLAVSGAVSVTRVLTVEATYTSSLGSGLPLKQEIRFPVDPLVAVP